MVKSDRGIRGEENRGSRRPPGMSKCLESPTSTGVSGSNRDNNSQNASVAGLGAKI